MPRVPQCPCPSVGLITCWCEPAGTEAEATSGVANPLAESSQLPMAHTIAEVLRASKKTKTMLFGFGTYNYGTCV